MGACTVVLVLIVDADMRRLEPEHDRVGRTFLSARMSWTCCGIGIGKWAYIDESSTKLVRHILHPICHPKEAIRLMKHFFRRRMMADACREPVEGSKALP